MGIIKDEYVEMNYSIKRGIEKTVELFDEVYSTQLDYYVWAENTSPEAFNLAESFLGMKKGFIEKAKLVENKLLPIALALDSKEENDSQEKLLNAIKDEAKNLKKDMDDIEKEYYSLTEPMPEPTSEPTPEGKLIESWIKYFERLDSKAKDLKAKKFNSDLYNINKDILSDNELATWKKVCEYLYILQDNNELQKRQIAVLRRYVSEASVGRDLVKKNYEELKSKINQHGSLTHEELIDSREKLIEALKKELLPDEKIKENVEKKEDEKLIETAKEQVQNIKGWKDDVEYLIFNLGHDITDNKKAITEAEKRIKENNERIEELKANDIGPDMDNYIKVLLGTHEKETDFYQKLLKNEFITKTKIYDYIRYMMEWAGSGVIKTPLYTDLESCNLNGVNVRGWNAFDRNSPEYLKDQEEIWPTEDDISTVQEITGNNEAGKKITIFKRAIHSIKSIDALVANKLRLSYNKLKNKWNERKEQKFEDKIDNIVKNNSFDDARKESRECYVKKNEGKAEKRNGIISDFVAVAEFYRRVNENQQMTSNHVYKSAEIGEVSSVPFEIWGGQSIANDTYTDDMSMKSFRAVSVPERTLRRTKSVASIQSV